jgi:Rps23 Pro-64 3,4-dihydroxylase Tpa1-like proline 4-hydroxylase
MFRLNPDLELDAFAAAYRRDGRVHIPGFLDGDAAGELHRLLRSRSDWRQVLTTAAGGVVELDRNTRAAMNPDQAAALNEAVYAQARSGFQYRFETLRVPDGLAERRASDDPLTAFAAWLSQGEARDFLRRVTGNGDIDYADAQATAYAPGDFLTGHDDEVSGKKRRAAYVFGLTPVWRIEWGGLLLFHDADGHVERGFSPAFNSLNLFAVPAMHSVSEVTRAAPNRRYSITGWLRTGPQPA